MFAAVKEGGPLAAEEPIVRLILDGTVVRVRLDRKACACAVRLAPMENTKESASGTYCARSLWAAAQHGVAAVDPGISPGAKPSP
jgi:hypothetical protein